ncbi:hypothetical protein [Halocynthiibacter styelae]|uniref:Uncharacterized protein n=1 Tax=Halocynthiibacter styelae TaxID=2761955 RepID=A0A8J7IUY3_9RHOB|nr:hypothetical protein [Paenihalocynthiibacter styelae]MBI1492978.1 hypothetical protein [Paenihalocynthiibacter styelae]
MKAATMIALAKSVEAFLSHKLVRLILLLPLPLFLLTRVNGQWLEVIAIISVLGSGFAGVLFAQCVGNAEMFRRVGVSDRISAGLSAFLFLFLPVFTHVLVFEGRVEIPFERHSLFAHFLWAVCVGVLFLVLSPDSDKK